MNLSEQTRLIDRLSHAHRILHDISEYIRDTKRKKISRKTVTNLLDVAAYDLERVSDALQKADLEN